MDCPICQGTGKIEETHRRICLACDGQGHVDGAQCTECGGSGEVTAVEVVTCDLCQGSGHLD